LRECRCVGASDRLLRWHAADPARAACLCVREQREAEFEKGEKGNVKTADLVKHREGDVIHSASMGKALKILERMVNQNAEVGISCT
jgi:hypothetical protein